MYLVKATIKAINPGAPNAKYKPVNAKGFYMPAGKQTARAKVEAECKEYLINKFKKDNPSLILEVSKLTIERQKVTFFLNEGTQS